MMFSPRFNMVNKNSSRKSPSEGTISLIENERGKSKEKEMIHSGHFMVSRVHDGTSGDYLSDNEENSIEASSSGFNFSAARKSTCTTYMFGSRSTQTLAIDASLSTLFEQLTLAFSGKITSPKWKQFRGMHMNVKEKIRINNIIWREWHMQYIHGQKARICQFATPLQDIAHNKPESVVLEGYYWKRRLDSIAKEYKMWRKFFRKGRFKHDNVYAFTMDELSHDELLQRVSEIQNISNIPKQQQTSNTDLILNTRDLQEMMDLSDSLFSTLLKQPFEFPNSRELYGCGYGDYIQPGLQQFQPNLQPNTQANFDDFMDFDVSEMFPVTKSSSFPQPTATVPAQSGPSLQVPTQDVDMGASRMIPSPEMILSPESPPLASSSLFDSSLATPTLASSLDTAQMVMESDNFILTELQLIQQWNQEQKLEKQKKEQQIQEQKKLQEQLLQLQLEQQKQQQQQMHAQRQEKLQQKILRLQREKQLQEQQKIQEKKLQEQQNMQEQLKKQEQQNMQVQQKLQEQQKKHEQQKMQEQKMQEQQKMQEKQKQIQVQQQKQREQMLELLENTEVKNMLLAPGNSGILTSLIQELSKGQQSIQQTQLPGNSANTSILMSLINSCSSVPPKEQIPHTDNMTARKENSNKIGTRSILEALNADENQKARNSSSSVHTQTLLKKICTMPNQSNMLKKDDSGFIVPMVPQKAQGSKQRILAPTPATTATSSSSVSKSNSFLAQLLTSGPVITVKDEVPAASLSHLQAPTIQHSSSVPVAITDFHNSLIIAAANQAFSSDNISVQEVMQTVNKQVASTSINQIFASSPLRMPTSQAPSPIRTCSPLPLSAAQVSSPVSTLAFNESLQNSQEEVFTEMIVGEDDNKDERLSDLLFSSDKKHRTPVKHGFEQLQAIIPSLRQSPNSKVSKAAMLQKTAEYCRKLKSERVHMQSEADILKQEINSLNQAISHCQSQLPATGVPITRQRADQMREMFEEYVKQRTLTNWKFWIFSLMIRNLFDSYNTMVSTTSVDELCRTVLAWLDQHCSLPALRPIVSDAMRHLSTTTSILSDPTRVPEQAAQAVIKRQKHKDNDT